MASFNSNDVILPKLCVFLLLYAICISYVYHVFFNCAELAIVDVCFSVYETQVL